MNQEVEIAERLAYQGLKFTIDGMTYLVSTAGKLSIRMFLALRAAASGRGKTKGEIALAKMLQKGEVGAMQLRGKDLEKFVGAAKKWGILYSAMLPEGVKSKKDIKSNDIVDIFFPASLASVVARLIEHINVNAVEIVDSIATVSDEGKMIYDGLVPVTIDIPALVKSEDEASYEVKVPGTWGKRETRMRIDKEYAELINPNEKYPDGKTIIAFLDKEAMYELFDAGGRSLGKKNGAELLKNFDEKTLSAAMSQKSNISDAMDRYVSSEVSKRRHLRTKRLAMTPEERENDNVVYAEIRRDGIREGIAGDGGIEYYAVLPDGRELRISEETALITADQAVLVVDREATYEVFDAGGRSLGEVTGAFVNNSLAVNIAGGAHITELDLPTSAQTELERKGKEYVDNKIKRIMEADEAWRAEHPGAAPHRSEQRLQGSVRVNESVKIDAVDNIEKELKAFESKNFDSLDALCAYYGEHILGTLNYMERESSGIDVKEYDQKADEIFDTKRNLVLSSNPEERAKLFYDARERVAAATGENERIMCESYLNSVIKMIDAAQETAVERDIKLMTGESHDESHSGTPTSVKGQLELLAAQDKVVDATEKYNEVVASIASHSVTHEMEVGR